MRNGESSRNAYIFVSVSLLLQLAFLFTTSQSVQVVDEVRTNYGALLNDFYMLRLAIVEGEPAEVVERAANELDSAISGLLGSEALAASARLVPNLARVTANIRSDWQRNLSVLIPWAASRGVPSSDGSRSEINELLETLGEDLAELEGPVDQMVTAQRRALQVVLYVLSATVLATIGIFQLIEREAIRVRAAAMQVKSLAQSTIGTQEQERARIARALHDSLAQELGSLLLHFGDDAGEMTRETGSEIRNRLVRAVAWLRNLAYELHPAEIEEVGLPTALLSYCDEVALRHSAPVQCDVDESIVFLPHDHSINIYRIAQEAVTNAIRHANATRISLSLLNLPERVVLTVEDNGEGFRTDGERRLGATRGLGLVGMRERANIVGGQLLLNSSPRAGTRVEFFLEKAEVEYRGEGAS